MRTGLYDRLRLAAASFVVLLLVALFIIGGLAWRNQRRLELVQVHARQLRALQTTDLNLEGLVIQDLLGLSVDQREELDDLQVEVAELIGLGGLSPQTPEQLRRVEAFLVDVNRSPRQALLASMSAFRSILSAETQAQAQMLEDIDRATRAEFQLTAAALIGLLILVAAVLWFLRRRIFAPLSDLGGLLSRVAGGEFAPVPTDKVDPTLLPLFHNYNDLVARLEELERAHRSHAQSLEKEVRTATKALLQQQQSLARAERLAAVGEVAASLAHELRNPVAAVQMSLSNLRRDLQDPSLVQRLDLMVGELQRMTRFLNNELALSRHAPEPARELDLAALVQELLALTRYQVPGSIALEAQIAPGQRCYLPEDRLRQALLNLVLNAAQALDGSTGTIRVSAENENGTIRIAVSDDGPGLPEALVNHGVRPFATTQEHGTGLGLAIVRRFVRDLGGDLQLANLEPHGACVTMRLPCRVDHG